MKTIIWLGGGHHNIRHCIKRLQHWESWEPPLCDIRDNYGRCPGAGDMARWSRASTILAEDLCSLSSSHIPAYSSKRYNALLRPPWALHLPVNSHTQTYKCIWNKSFFKKLKGKMGLPLTVFAMNNQAPRHHPRLKLEVRFRGSASLTAPTVASWVGYLAQASSASVSLFTVPVI